MYRFSGGWKQVSKGANPIYHLGTIFIWNFQKRESWYSIIFLIHVDMCLYKSPNWKHNFRICWILIITLEIHIIMIPIFNYLVFSYSGLKLFDAKYRQNHESNISFQVILKIHLPPPPPLWVGVEKPQTILLAYMKNMKRKWKTPEERKRMFGK